MAWFTAERLSLLAAIERCCAFGSYEVAARLGSSMASFEYLQGRLDDTERTWRLIANAALQACDPAATAHAELRVAAAACGQGRHAEARPIVDRCVQLFNEHADRCALSTALYWRAVCDWNLGTYADAQQSADHAIRLAHDVGDRQTEILALRIRAIAQANLPGYSNDAVSSAERARALVRGLAQPGVEHEVLHTLVSVYNLVGRHEDALQLSRESLGLAENLGPQAIADRLGQLGDSYHGLGRYREAAQSLSQALPIYRDHFMRRHHALCLLKIGNACQAMADHEAAISHLEESLGIFEQLQLDHYAERAREALSSCQSSQRAARSDLLSTPGQLPAADARPRPPSR
jgi:tetratricopeptide (TPR) repeat protein